MTSPRYTVLNKNCAGVGDVYRFRVDPSGALLTSSRWFGPFSDVWAPGTWAYVIPWEN